MPDLEAKDEGELRQRGRKRHCVPRIPKDHSENEASLVAQMIKNLPANAGDPGSIHGLGRSPGEGNGNQLQYSCLENSMDRGAWWATIYGITESDTTKQVTPIYSENARGQSCLSVIMSGTGAIFWKERKKEQVIITDCVFKFMKYSCKIEESESGSAVSDSLRPHRLVHGTL